MFLLDPDNRLKGLIDWETRLRPQIAGGDVLLGQLPIGHQPYDRDHMNELGELLAGVFSDSRPLDLALRRAREHCPIAFALYLTLQGIYCYNGGEYWPNIRNHLYIADTGVFGYRCGSAFRSILRRFRLPTFENIAGHANLVPILAHGIIPNYSLNDFFDLLHKHTCDHVIAVDAATLMAEWIADPDHTMYAIDRPARRFVLHGGRLAEDFVNRCLNLFETDSAQDIRELQLPERIVAHFEKWRERSGYRTAERKRIRLAHPFLYADPYGDGVGVALPPQFYPTAVRQPKLIWQIRAGQSTWEEPTQRERLSDGYEYVVSNLVRPPVEPSYEVLLLDNGSPLRRWELFGPGEPPLLVFDPDTGKCLGQSDRIRPGDRWILYPRTWVLEIEHGQRVREFPRLYGKWSQFAIEEWRVPSGTTIRLVAAQGDVYELAVTHEIALRRPFFRGGHRPLFQQVHDDFPLFSGYPPSLVISFAEPPDSHQLARWRITVLADGKADPGERKSHLLCDLSGALTIEDSTCVIDLGAPELLGATPVGKFEVQAVGPYGRGRHMGLRIVPHLAISGQRDLYLSAADGPATMRLNCGGGAQIRLRSSDDGIELKPSESPPGQYSIQIEPEITQVRLDVLHRASGVAVPFVLQPRRMRWGLWDVEMQENFRWQTSPIRLCPDILPNLHGAELYVDLPAFGDEEGRLYAGWRLITSDDAIKAQRPPDLERSRQRFEIHLGELLPSYREAKDAGEILRLQLWLQVGSKDVDQRLVDVLYLLPWLELGEIEADWRESESGWQITVMWEHPQKARYRYLLVWPVDQPWRATPIMLPVPDEADCFAEWRSDSITSYMPKQVSYQGYQGSFLGEIVVRDPWDTSEPERPTLASPNVLQLDHPNRAPYYAMLGNAADEGAASAESLLTLMACQHRTGQLDAMHKTNAAIRSLGTRLTPAQLTLWADCAKACCEHDPLAYRLVSEYTMFLPEHLQGLKAVSPGTELHRRYFDHLPTNGRNPDMYENVLDGGFPQARAQCITELCHLANQRGYLELLADVAAGRMLVSDAIQLLQPTIKSAADFFTARFLAGKGENEAVELWMEATRQADLIPAWIEPGRLIRTNLGIGRVDNIRSMCDDREIAFCLPDDSVHLSVTLHPDCDPLSVTLNPSTGKVGSIRPDRRIYQCGNCQQLFTSTDAVSQHHRRDHDYRQHLAFRQIEGKRLDLLRLSEINCTAEGEQ